MNTDVMSRWKRSLLLVVMSLLFGTAIAKGDVLRLPTSGSPAFSVDVPAGWNPTYDQWGNLNIQAADRSSDLQLSTTTSTDLATTSTDQLAAGIMKAAGALPYFSSQPDTVVWHAGQAYYSHLTVETTHWNVKVVIAMLDATHAAIIATMTQDNITTAQSALSPACSQTCNS